MKIHIENFCFETIIGLLEFERHTPQTVCIHATLWYTFSPNTYIDYALVCESIQTHLNTARYGLLEEALEGTAALLMQHYPLLKKITLRIDKPTILSHALVGVSKTYFRAKIKN